MVSVGKQTIRLTVAGTVMLLVAGCAQTDGADEIGRVLLALLVALVASKLGGELCVRVGQPAVLGELLLGIVVGNLALIGYHGLDFIGSDHSIEVIAELGVVLLLFQVGLESDLGETVKVGSSSLTVALLGVVAPLILGWGVAALWMPDAGTYAHIFVGATLCATSVGITARVLRDLRQTKTPAARIILGAAVIDDVLGLVILAIIQSAISATALGGALSPCGVALVVLKSVLFLICAPLVGRILVPQAFRLVARFKGEDLLLIAGLATCFGFAYIAKLVGLAPIVGAFAAGLMLEEAHWRDLQARGEHSLDELIAPLVGFLAPVFFFRMGVGVSLANLANLPALSLAAALTLVALVGKQVSGLGVLQKGVDRLSVGIGMIPRGEVGLIFAAVGTKLVIDRTPVVPPTVFAALIVTVACTTVVTPPLLKWSFSRSGAARRRS